MQDIDANIIEPNSLVEADLCIIGGGAAGITVAKSLVGSGLKVALLESGKHSYHEKTQQLYDFDNLGHPLRSQSGYISRNRYLGGSTNTWQGRCSPLDKLDFEKRDWIMNSGWPISKEDLLPYYKQANGTLMLPDFENFTNNVWLKQVIDAPEKFLRDAALEALVFLFGKTNINMRKAYAGELKASSNVQIIINANVKNIQSDLNQSTVESLIIATLTGNQFKVMAKKYVLCCGGWENARLLLLSNSVNQKGLGNDYDVVGRYYAEHPKIQGSKIYPSSKTLRSPIMFWPRKIKPVGKIRIGIRLSAKYQQIHRLPNNYIELMYPQSMRDSIEQSETFFRNLRLSKSIIHQMIKFAPHVFTLADAVERLVFNMPLKFEHISLISHMEQVPDRESRVFLGAEKDALNLPRLQVKLKVSENDKENLRQYHRVFGQLIEEQNLGRLESGLLRDGGDWGGLTDSSHHMGTTRMHDDPKHGVVDKNCKVHGLDNLYIAGSSVFPIGGSVNPTMTIVALAHRLVDEIKSQYSRQQ